MSGFSYSAAIQHGMPGQADESLREDEELDSTDDSLVVQDIDDQSSDDLEGDVDLLQSKAEQAQRAPAGDRPVSQFKPKQK